MHYEIRGRLTYFWKRGHFVWRKVWDALFSALCNKLTKKTPLTDKEYREVSGTFVGRYPATKYGQSLAFASVGAGSRL